MSGFFGIFRPQGGPVDLEVFEQMKTAMNRKGFDGMETHVEDKIAMGHLMLRVSPESKYDKQPLKSSCGNFLLVGHFRLDYRDELGDKLGLTAAELELTPDSLLAMMAYQKWKEKCVHHLEGDWAAVFFLKKENSILLLKDTIGFAALYYIILKESIFFSSDVDMFAKINSFHLTLEMSQVIRLSQPGFSLEEGCTLYKGLKHVKNSEQLVFNQQGIFLSTVYAKVKLHNGTVNCRFEADYFLEYKSLFVSAVRSRMRFTGEKGIFLSGGMDSTALLYFMEKESTFDGGKIVSYTSIPDLNFLDNKSEINAFQEFDLIQELKKNNGDVSYSFLSFPQVELFETLSADRKRSGLNPIVSNNTFWIEGILKESKKRDIRRVFNGQLGNFTLTWNAPQLSLNQFLKLDLLNLFSNLLSSSKKNNVSFLKVLWGEVFSQMYMYIKTRVNAINGYSKQILVDKSIFQNHVLRVELGKAREIKNSFIPGLNFYTSPTAMRAAVFNIVIKHIGMQWYLESHRHALESVDPTSDRRFVEFSFMIPSKLFYSKGVRKYMYKNVMKGLLPDSITNSTQTFKQSLDIRKRIIADAEINVFMAKVKNNEPLKKVFKLDMLFSDYELIKTTETNIALSFVNNFLKNLSIVRFYCLNTIILPD
jgi:asparagine synthase (glutamine-hydrolysing)